MEYISFIFCSEGSIREKKGCRWDCIKHEEMDELRDKRPPVLFFFSVLDDPILLFFVDDWFCPIHRLDRDRNGPSDTVVFFMLLL